jgi:hypothetical protein
MLVFRSLVVGLLGACCLLLAQRPRYAARAPIVVPRPASTWDGALPPTVAEDQVAGLERLQPGEQVTAMDAPQRYLDVTVAGPYGQRRVLVLMH